MFSQLYGSQSNGPFLLIHCNNFTVFPGDIYNDVVISADYNFSLCKKIRTALKDLQYLDEFYSIIFTFH